MTLGDLVREYREKHNISMDDFSKMCKLSKGYISMLENNINPRNNKPIAPTLPTIKKIALAMNVDMDSILKALDSDQEINLASSTLECSPVNFASQEDGSTPDQRHTYHLCQKEELLLSDFRTLNEQGQDYILQTMDMVKDKYKKSNLLSDMEEIV